MHIIGGKYKGIKLFAPKGLAVRPTSGRLREAVFNILQNDTPDSTFLDIFAGSGAMGFEALSRGAKCVSFIDADKSSIDAIHKNLDSIQAKDFAKIYQGDAIEVLIKLSKLKISFDIIYVDPPYQKFVIFEEKKELLSRVILKIIEKENLLNSKGILFIEEGEKLDATELCLQKLSLKRIKKQGRTFLHEFYKKSEIEESTQVNNIINEQEF